MSSIRFWLNDAAMQSPTNTAKEGGGDTSTFNGMRVETEKSGEKYITVYEDPNDPSASIPVIPRKNLKRVSYAGKYFEGFRADGLYHYKGATAHVETIEGTDGYGETQFDRRYQKIRISAGSIRTLREIYSKIRTDELKPTKDWGKALRVVQQELGEK